MAQVRPVPTSRPKVGPRAFLGLTANGGVLARLSTPLLQKKTQVITAIRNALAESLQAVERTAAMAQEKPPPEKPGRNAGQG